MSETFSRPCAPGGFIAAPTMVLLGLEECLLAKRDGELKCVRGDHDHVKEVSA